MLRTVYVRKEELWPTKVRQVCIKHNLYTRGDCEAYSEMFRKCADYHGDVNDLAKVAWDIVDHSDYEEFEDYGFETALECVEFVINELLTDCVYVHVEVKEVDE